MADELIAQLTNAGVVSDPLDLLVIAPRTSGTSPTDPTLNTYGDAQNAFLKDLRIAESALSITDITTNNVSTSAHGFAPKAPNDATKYLDGSGSYSVPPGSSGTPGGSFFGPTMQRMTYSVPGYGVVGDVQGTFGATGGAGGSVNFGITAVTANSSGITGNTLYETIHNVNARFRYGLNQLTNVRAWIALTDQSGTTQGGSDNPAGNYAGFRFSSAAGDTHWQAITKDNSTQTIADTGVAPSAGVMQYFSVLTHSGTSLDFYISGSKVATITTHLPGTTTALRYAYCIQAITSTGVQALLGEAYIFMDAEF